MATRQKRAKKASSDRKNCVHKFTSTGEKSTWSVEARPTNNRGGSKWVDVTVTVFKCIKCGEKKEYPDNWEPNYVTPKNVVKMQRPKKTAAKRKAINA